MTHNNLKIIFSDMDGTLLDKHEVLPSNFDEMMQELAQRDILFVGASGRSAKSMEYKFTKYYDNLYLICDNGAMVKYNNEIIHHDYFSHDEYLDIMHAIKQIPNSTLSAVSKHLSYIQLGHDDLDPEMFMEFYGDFKFVNDIVSVDEEVHSIALFSYDTDTNIQHPIIEKLKEKYAVKRNGAEWINISLKHVNKGNTITQLLKKLDIDSKHAIAFGDFNNDIEMLSVVHKGYAMEDAVPALKAIADEVIGSNADNSVVKKIYEILGQTHEN